MGGDDTWRKAKPVSLHECVVKYGSKPAANTQAWNRYDKRRREQARSSQAVRGMREVNAWMLVLSSVGASAITSQSLLFSWLHQWGERIRPNWPLTAHLTTCMQCQSVWWALGLSALAKVDLIESVLVAFAASGLAWMAQLAAYRLTVQDETKPQGKSPESLPQEGLARPE